MASHAPKPRKQPTPFRQIRALFDADTITVYQAYSDAIASAAVDNQRLDASPDFKPSRMTWIKPSFAWMMYRAGYSYKDDRQSRILALKMTYEGFFALLRNAQLTHGAAQGGSSAAESHAAKVKVQWDPERTPKMGKLTYRSIQIGIPGLLVGEWVRDWIVEIQDVTDQARALKAAIDGDPAIPNQDLIDNGLVPLEREFQVPDDIRQILRMDYDEAK
jgi:hypothetical protein